MSRVSDEIPNLDPSPSERYQKLLRYDIPKAALRRYVDDENLSVRGISKSPRKAVAKSLDDDQIDRLIQEYKFAGKQSINYFVITGISDKNFDATSREVKSSTPVSKEEVKAVREPYIATSDVLGDKLYLSFGYLESQGDVDPKTGIETIEEIRGRCVAVIRPDTDLVAVRCSDESMAKKAANQISSSLNVERESASYRPDFGWEFEERFREELVEKYYSLKIRINDKEGRTVETIRYSSKTDEQGERQDAREDADVKHQLENHGGDIRMGYVELKSGSKFYMNRDKSKISFIAYEREKSISEITEVIDDVLRQTGEYPQRKLQRVDDVPK